MLPHIWLQLFQEHYVNHIYSAGLKCSLPLNFWTNREFHKLLNLILWTTFKRYINIWKYQKLLHYFLSSKEGQVAPHLKPTFIVYSLHYCFWKIENEQSTSSYEGVNLQVWYHYIFYGGYLPSKEFISQLECPGTAVDHYTIDNVLWTELG